MQTAIFLLPILRQNSSDEANIASKDAPSDIKGYIDGDTSGLARALITVTQRLKSASLFSVHSLITG